MVKVMSHKKKTQIEFMAGKRRTIDGTCVVVEDVMKSVKIYSKTLGWGPWNIYHCKPPKLSNTTLRGKPVDYTMDFAITKVGRAYFELIAPVDGPSTYREFLERGERGVQHIQSNYTSANTVKKILDDYKKAGIGLVQTGRFCGNEFFYLDTEKTLGTIYEILKVGPLDPPDQTYP
jgi:methylmalonyl-CoA/ethylmalonyl-CoA epimerase